jgi:cell division protein FtsW (lipid II flippase)
MLLLVILAIAAIALFSAGFVIHWLFIVAVVVALVWVIAMFTGGFGRTSSRRL